MAHSEFLLGYGTVGDFGRFRADQPFRCRRGDRAVIRSHRGLELGVVMRPVETASDKLLADRFVGQLLRLATREDEQTAARLEARCREVFLQSRQLASKLNLPLELLDAEMLFDEDQVILHYLRWAECDPRPLLDAISDRYRLLVTLHDLGLPHQDEDDLGSCGSGSCGAGNCGSCASGRCGTCGSAALPGRVTPHQIGSAMPVAAPAPALEPGRIALL
jgi:hypothetical protein